MDVGGFHAALGARTPSNMTIPRTPARADPNAEEGDYCRICRGEGTEEEPLFYPCKCSGSIKFVHQACLMEWLSHSQKKYCELCKTPFRFTKLYDPHMPGRLPTPIFLRQLFTHAAKGMLTWARLLLVISVWLGWLPWSMRQVWRVLFYIVDCRWTVQYPDHALNHVVNATSSIAAYQTFSNSSTAVGSNTTIAAFQNGFLHTLPTLLAPLTGLLGVSNSQFLLLRIVQTMFPSFFRWTQSISADYAVADGQSSPIIMHRNTMLGEVSYLKTLTTSPTINNTVIDVLEGQLICLSLVVVTILLFLIREWVINQAPLNIPEVADAQPAVGGQAVGDVDRVAVEEVAQDIPQNVPPPPSPDANAASDSDDASISETDDEEAENGDDAPDSRTSSRSRPGLTGRNAMADATSIRRSIEEQSDSNSAWPGLETFKELWSRAGADPSRVLEIIAEENKTEELGWIVSQMDRLQRSGRLRNIPGESSRGSAASPADTSEHMNGMPSLADIRQGMGSPSLWENLESQERQHRSGLDIRSGESISSPGAMDANVTEPQDIGQHTPATADESDPAESSPPAEQQLSGPHQAPENPIVGDQGILDKVLFWFWGNDLYQGESANQDNQPGEDDERVIENIDREAPFVPVQPQQPFIPERPQDDPPLAAEANRDPEVAAAAAEAGIDLNNVDAAEELEDFDGIFELIGLQGPITGLVQNVVFSQFLISLALLAGVGTPYVWGLLALHVLSHPVSVLIKLPIAITTTLVDIVVDTTLFVAGLLLCSVFSVLSTAQRLLFMLFPPLTRFINVNRVTSASFTLVSRSGTRLEKTLISLLLGDGISLPNMTTSAQRSLHAIKDLVLSTVRTGGSIASRYLLEFPGWSSFKEPMQRLMAGAVYILSSTVDSIKNFHNFPRLIWAESIGNGTSPTPSADEVLNAPMQQWTAGDRALAIALGYAAIILLGAFYLRVVQYIWKIKEGEKSEGIVADVVHQAGGVLKVILIIGIEMIVFPFYCGLLLDVALLPLFQDASIESRIAFFGQSPLTALFVHWFVGTCYMFHFALFVSMCRKLMRKGVLYFIRDPEDPTFHPVRDVLERNVGTQLSKIAFSGLVYGGLVMICLGGIVWGLSAFDGVLPIHWASGGPVLEFPVDLLFYSFALPLLLRNIKLSKKIEGVYKWWFGVVAGWLRLSDFLFGEKRENEQGRHVRRTWLDVFSGKKGDVTQPVIGEDRQVLVEDRQVNVYFLRDGKFVRTPASDSVRIPKGQRVFLEVNEENERIDDHPDSDEGPYGKKNKDYTMVYVPPWFRLRIALFVGHVWIFTAVVGACITVLPLLTGRQIVHRASPATIEVNDLYAFTIGCSLSLGLVYCATHISNFRTFISSSASKLHISPDISTRALSMTKRVLSLIYVLNFTLVVLPLTLSLLSELYIFTPLHTYLSSQQTKPSDFPPPPSPKAGSGPISDHKIHLVQSYFLGILLTRLFLRLCLNHPHRNTLIATAIRSITSPPYSPTRPNAGLFTRALLIPSTTLLVLLFTLPLLLGWGLNTFLTPHLLRSSFTSPSFSFNAEQLETNIYRYSYPGVAFMLLVAYCTVLGKQGVERWRGRIRDEVYLVGERLHNFGEGKDKKGKGRARMI